MSSLSAENVSNKANTCVTDNRTLKLLNYPFNTHFTFLVTADVELTESVPDLIVSSLLLSVCKHRTIIICCHALPHTSCCLSTDVLAEVHHWWPHEPQEASVSFILTLTQQTYPTLTNCSTFSPMHDMFSPFGLVTDLNLNLSAYNSTCTLLKHLHTAR